MSLGSKIYEMRRLRNMTQENLADALGVTRQSVSRWEQDIVYPDLEKIVKLSNILEVSCDYLLKDEELVEKKTSKSSRLLESIIGKRVRLEFYDEAPSLQFYVVKNICIIKEIEDNMVKVELTIVKKKEKEVKEFIFPLDTIESFIIMED